MLCRANHFYPGFSNDICELLISMRYKIQGSFLNFLVHFPLLQPIISLSYLLEIQAIDDKILENKTNYKKFESAETYMDRSNRKVCRKTALGCSRTNARLKKLKIKISTHRHHQFLLYCPGVEPADARQAQLAARAAAGAGRAAGIRPR